MKRSEKKYTTRRFRHRKAYYTTANLHKLLDALMEAKTGLEAGTIDKVISVSVGNKKMGLVHSVSLLPFITCPGICAGTCGKYCYAAKIALLRSSVLKAYARNTALLIWWPEIFWTQVKAAAIASRFFRFHVSGDIRNLAHLEQIMKIVRSCRATKFLIFTKRFDAVNQYLDNHAGKLPRNLKLIFSAEENITPDSPHNLPVAIVLKAGQTPPPGAIVCNDNCFDCFLYGKGCWELKPGMILCFYEH